VMLGFTDFIFFGESSMRLSPRRYREPFTFAANPPASFSILAWNHEA